MYSADPSSRRRQLGVAVIFRSRRGDTRIITTLWRATPRQAPSVAARVGGLEQRMPPSHWARAAPDPRPRPRHARGSAPSALLDSSPALHRAVRNPPERLRLVGCADGRLGDSHTGRGGPPREADTIRRSSGAGKLPPSVRSGSPSKRPRRLRSPGRPRRCRRGREGAYAPGSPTMRPQSRRRQFSSGGPDSASRITRPHDVARWRPPEARRRAAHHAPPNTVRSRSNLATRRGAPRRIRPSRAGGECVQRLLPLEAAGHQTVPPARLARDGRAHPRRGSMLPPGRSSEGERNTRVERLPPAYAPCRSFLDQRCSPRGASLVVVRRRIEPRPDRLSRGTSAPEDLEVSARPERRGTFLNARARAAAWSPMQCTRRLEPCRHARMRSSARAVPSARGRFPGRPRTGEHRAPAAQARPRTA